MSVKTADAETIPAGQLAKAAFDPKTGNIHFKIPKGDPGSPGGPGLDPSLTKIIHANWMRDDPAQLMTIGQFMEGLRVVFSDSINIRPNMWRGWFIVTVEYPISDPLSDPSAFPYLQQATIFSQRVLDDTISLETTIKTDDTVLFRPRSEYL